MNIALKEWALVCDLLVEGEQIALLRKGGIHEPHRGAFALEHDTFLLYPNAEHQSVEQVQERYLDRLTGDSPVPRQDGEIVIPGYCRVTDLLPVSDPGRVRALEAHTCWTQAFFDVRLAYKPERLNHLVLVRAYRFPTPLRLPYHKIYAGCRSWVPLKDDVDESLVRAAAPTLNDARYQERRREVLFAVS